MADDNSLNDDYLYYKGEKIKTTVTSKFIEENLEIILSSKNIQKYFTEKDATRLLPLMTKINPNISIKKAIEFSLDSKMAKFVPPVALFKKMIRNDFFTEEYQNNLERLKIDSLESLINVYEERYTKTKRDKVKYIEALQGVVSIPGVILPDFEEASSGYTTLGEELDDDSQASVKMSEIEGFIDDERFRLKVSKNGITIRNRSEEEVKEYHLKEKERYLNPHLPFIYSDLQGLDTVVAPVLRKLPSGITSKPRDHFLLKPDRPSFVTILCLARDAASRLPDGVGTRADICELLKDSQYINERLSSSQLNSVVSGALDRLHYEKDPCVKYDLQKKLWIYLHKNRSTEYQPWKDHLKKSENSESNDASFNATPKKAKKEKSQKLLKHKRKHSVQINN